MKSRFSACLLLVSLLLGGCGLFTVDAVAYVSATLDYYYGHENAEQYLEYILLDPDRLEAEYQAGLERDAENFLTHLGVETAHESLYALITPLMEQLNSRISYELPEKQEKSDMGYLVTVNVRPLLLFGGVTAEELAAALSPVWSAYPDAVRSGNAEFEAAYVQAFVSLLSDKLDAPVYGEQTAVELHIDRQEDNNYALRQEDFQAFWQLAVSYE